MGHRCKREIMGIESVRGERRIRKVKRVKIYYRYMYEDSITKPPNTVRKVEEGREKDG
jgi:hypothetical protein